MTVDVETAIQEPRKLNTVPSVCAARAPKFKRIALSPRLIIFAFTKQNAQDKRVRIAG